MKYYIVIGHKKGEVIQGEFGKNYDCDWIEMIERDDEYSPTDFPPGAHQLFGFLDVNFNESVQYGFRASKTQEAWLIGRHRIARMLDFGNFGYQFVRENNTKRIQFPDRITISFDKRIRDNNVNKPLNDDQRVDIELTNLNEQIINCYDKECNIDPIVFKLSKFDNYGDAYIDLQEMNNLEDFKLQIDHFVHFMRNYPNSNIFLVCKPENESNIKTLLRNIIKNEHLTNYFEFCDANFDRRAPGYNGKRSGTANSEYDTFSDTIEEFFDENTFNKNQNSEKNFFNVPFNKAKITVNNNWHVYENSEKFKKFLQNNPTITLEITGTIEAQNVAEFIKSNSIKANIVLTGAPNNREIEAAIAHNRKDELQKLISQYGYDDVDSISEEEENNEEYRLNIEKYIPQKLNLTNAQIQNADVQVGQNQNQNQNQNQAQQLRQSNNAPYEPIKLEINNKSSIPDVNFGIQDKLLKSLIGLPFQSNENAPQTETNINYIFTAMAKIIEESPANKDCYCPLSYSVEELVPGSFYVPKERVRTIPHPSSSAYVFNEDKNTLFFSPPYASIAIKKDKYAFKPYHRLAHTSAPGISQELTSAINKDKFLNNLIGEYQRRGQADKFNLLLNELYAKRGQSGIDLLTKSLYALKVKNPTTYQSLIEHYLLTSNDFSEYTDDTRYIATFEVLAKLKDKKRVDWWNKLLEIQCRSNPNFDLNHLFSQFTSFWEDMDKLQKFIPIPEQFPFDDFADAGITLGKMHRIMSSARNRFEQIKSFEGGNISHAYMLFDLFNISMYSKEMDDYCVKLTKQLKAEDAFDKSKLKATYFSPRKLDELARDTNITLANLKSYLLIFAAVNGNTQKHNNSDLAFYNALFKAIEDSIVGKHYSDPEKKVIYATIMLFASYGNNTTKERMVQDITAFVQHKDLVNTCLNILDIYQDKTVSDFFSAQENNGKMANSEEMPAFHTIVALTQKASDYKKIIQDSTNLILGNKSLSLALQKIMRDAPDHLMHFASRPWYLANKNDEREHLIQSIFLIATAVNQNYRDSISEEDFIVFASSLYSLDLTRVTYLNQLFLDIDFTTFPKNASLFTQKNMSLEFCSKASRTQSLDDLIFLLQDYHVQLSTIKASTQGLLERIKHLENDLGSDDKKKHYATNYQHLLIIQLRSILGTNELVDLFSQSFIKKIDSSFSPQTLKASYEALTQIVNSKKKDDLLKLIPTLAGFQIGNSKQDIAPDQLLNVTALLMKHIYPIEDVINFLGTINHSAPEKANAKLHYLQSIFEKIAQEPPTCYENNDPRKKFNKETADKIKACMTLIKAIDTVDASLLNRILAGLHSGEVLTIQQYLQFLEVLASPTNIGNDVVKKEFTEINNTVFDLLQRYPNSFSDLLDIAKFDVELIDKLSFNSRSELSLVAKICKNEVLLNSRKTEQLAGNYKQKFAQNIKVLLDKKLNLDKFYSKNQLAHPSAAELVQLLDHYHNNVKKAHHHYEKDPWFNRPHKKKDIFGNNLVEDKELAYQTGQFDMSKQNDVLDQITRNDSGFEKSTRKNLLFTFSTYINELGFRLPAFQHNDASVKKKVPVRQLSDEEIKAEFEQVRDQIARLRTNGQDNIWQNKKYQRSVCKLLALIREAVCRDGNKNAYSTQIDAILLALLAGDYQYAMQINTGEGKVIIAAAIAIALQTITDKQVVVTTSNLSLANRDAEIYNRLIQWFGITHETISATTKDKTKLQAEIIHTTANDFALCHGKDLVINNSNRIYLHDESDYTLSHLTPSINSQSKANEEDNWWLYEEILKYVVSLDEKEAKRKPAQQAQGLIIKLANQFNGQIRTIEEELARRLHEVEQNADHKTPEEQMVAKEAVEKDCSERIAFYAKRIAKLRAFDTEDQFNALIDSAIIAQYVLRKGEGYEVIDQFEEGKILKKVVPTEGGKPIIEGDVLYMYGIHQFLIQKTLMEYQDAGDKSEFLKPSVLESTTYFNNYSIQAGSKSIGITGTVPKAKYKMYEALIGGGKSDVIPPHQVSQRKDAVPYEDFKKLKIGSEHVCKTEEELIKKLVKEIQAHDGPALVYCSNKNSSEAIRDELSKRLATLGYTVQMIIPGVTDDFTNGDKLTTLGRRAQNQKTITLTVGDGRGIDISPKGKDGLLTIPAFAAETPEKILQIYGRSGRNGKPGKTNLFILESELTKYGIKFNNLDKEFKFLDEIRHKEFDFAIKKIGFMQYEVQKLIRDDEKKTIIIAYMDDLYNRLLLRAVADKVKNKKENWIGSHKISGRWEPFVMLNDRELENIYSKFCEAVSDKLSDLQLYNIDIESIKKTHDQYHQQAKEAVEGEKEAQKGLDRGSIRTKIERHSEKQTDRLLYSYDDAVELSDGTEVALSDAAVRDAYYSFALNLGKYDKTVAMMQKYVGTHLGLYGFINEEICLPYEQVYQLLEQQKQVIREYQKEEMDIFYDYLISKESLEAIDLLLNDIKLGSKQNQKNVATYFQNAERYNNVAKIDKKIGGSTIANIREMALNYYQNDSVSEVDEEIFWVLKNILDKEIKNTRKAITDREETIINRCQEIYQQLQENIYNQSSEGLNALADRPLSKNDSKLAVLFSMVQMVSNEERDSEPVKRIVSEISEEVGPTVNEYNGLVKEYKEIIKQQREHLDFLKRSHDTQEKINKYEEMVNFDDVASKNMVAFYHEYNKAPETLQALSKDIKEEKRYLNELVAEVEQIKLAEQAEIERRRLAKEAEERAKVIERQKQEQDRRDQVEREKRNQYLNAVGGQLSEALHAFSEKIKKIEHPLTDAIDVANTLLTQLEVEKNNYLDNLGEALTNLDLSIKEFKNHSTIDEVNKAYTKACRNLINDEATRNVLERDLDWGTYLNNLLKTLVNIVISAVTFGTANNFFTLDKSETLRTIDEEQNSLNPPKV